MIFTNGIPKFGFGRDVPPQNLKVDPYIHQMFQEKVTHSYTDRPNFEQNHQIFPFQKKKKKESILAQIWENFEKSTHSYTKRLILLPTLAAHSRRVFCIEYQGSRKCGSTGAALLGNGRPN